MRDPSIHIRRSSLSEILKEIVQGDIEYIIDEIFKRSNMHAIRNRVLVEVKSRDKKRLERIASVDKDLAERFHAIYQQVNMNNNIRTSVIKQTDSKYATLKEVAQQAKNFCDMFNLEEESGFKAYVTIGIKLSGNNYSIYRLKGLADKIIKYYEDILAIENDEDSDGTTDFYVAWQNAMIKHTGRSMSIEDPHMYVNFIYGRQAANKTEAKFEDWVEAQFERWTPSGTIPELYHLFGDNAELAYTKYIAAKKKKYGSKEEEAYFENRRVRVKAVKRGKTTDKKKIQGDM